MGQVFNGAIGLQSHDDEFIDLNELAVLSIIIDSGMISSDLPSSRLYLRDHQALTTKACTRKLLLITSLS